MRVVVQYPAHFPEVWVPSWFVPGWVCFGWPACQCVHVPDGGGGGGAGRAVMGGAAVVGVVRGVEQSLSWSATKSYSARSIVMPRARLTLTWMVR